MVQDVIDDNQADVLGGAINAGGSNLTIKQSTISGNTAGGTGVGGGGVSFNGGTLAVTGSTISGNTASYGGGFDLSAGGNDEKLGARKRAELAGQFI